MSKEDDNKAIVGRWFTEFWGKTVNLGVIDEIAKDAGQDLAQGVNRRDASCRQANRAHHLP